MNYAKTSVRSAIWHQIRPDDDEPSYCGLGMLKPQRWAVMADAVPIGELLCLRCERSTLGLGVIRLAAEHGCRPEPHCVCGHNAWYHADDDPAACHMQGCTCQDYDRCPFTSP